ncbi:MAG: YCF48-related protein, partial [Acidimicrobiia bacterium]
MGSALLALFVAVTALAAPIGPAGAAPLATYADDFSSLGFSGSTGSVLWSTPWAETGEADGPGLGSIQVRNEPHCVTDPCLTLGRSAGPDAAVVRGLDLAGAASVVLSFDYKRHTHPPGSGTAALHVTNNGGADWYFLDAWPLDATDSGPVSASYDISAYAGASTQIRFSIAASSDDSHLNIDNLVVTFSPWAEQSAPVEDWNDVDFVDNEIGFVVGTGGAAARTTDGGESWSAMTTGTSRNLHSVSFVDSLVGFAVGANDSIIKSVNGGSDWTSLDSPSNKTLRGVDFLDASIGYAVGDGDTILKTIDGGAIWTAQDSPESKALYSVDFLDADIGYAVGGLGVVIKTIDGGANWVVQPTPVTYNLRGVFFIDSLQGWAVGDSGSVLATSDGGANWVAQATATGRNLYAVHFSNGNQGTAVGNSGTILRTSDGGANWIEDPVATGVNLRSVDFPVSASVGWAVGEGGVILNTGLLAPIPVPSMVVSEFSTRNEDFIELYNAGLGSVDINGFQVQLDGHSDVTIDQGGLPIIVPPGGHYLLVESGTGIAALADQLLPPSGINSSIGIRVVDSHNNLLDEVGTEFTTWYEGTPLPSQPAGPIQSYERRGSGTMGNCVDTHNNLADFVHNYGFNDPQNLASPATPCGTASTGSHVVISEFRPSGPAGDDDEFIEIFNPTAGIVDISDWVLHVTEPGLFRDYHVVPGGTTLDPGEHYLLSDGAGPVPNDAQPFDIATNYPDLWADVVLKDNVGTVVDVLGYGDTVNGQLFEGTAMPAYPSGTDDRSYERRHGGYTDTDVNIQDFVYSFVASPQRSDPGPNQPPVFNQDLLDRSDAEGTLI